MDYHVRLHVTTAVLVVTLGIVVSTVTSTIVAARAYQQHGRDASRRQQTITVKGAARQRIQSDRAVWHITVRAEGQALPDTFSMLQRGVTRAEQFLKAADFKDAEIGLGAIDTETLYARNAKGQPTHEVVGYALQRSFFIATVDVRRVEQSAGQVTEILQEGVLVISKAPAYYYTRLPQLKLDLMATASADARARAERIASSTGCKLGELGDAQMGVLQITQPDSTEVADYGLYDTSTIDKDVNAVVTATFGIQSG
jgi:hypothetical protein